MHVQNATSKKRFYFINIWKGQQYGRPPPSAPSTHTHFVWNVSTICAYNNHGRNAHRHIIQIYLYNLIRNLSRIDKVSIWKFIWNRCCCGCGCCCYFAVCGQLFIGVHVHLEILCVSVLPLPHRKCYRVALWHGFLNPSYRRLTGRWVRLCVHCVLWQSGITHSHTHTHTFRPSVCVWWVMLGIRT